VIFLKENDHAVLEFDALGLLRLESRQWWDLYLLQALGLS
jgi:hypothetical protein